MEKKRQEEDEEEEEDEKEEMEEEGGERERAKGKSNRRDGGRWNMNHLGSKNTDFIVVLRGMAPEVTREGARNHQRKHNLGNQILSKH